MHARFCGHFHLRSDKNSGSVFFREVPVAQNFGTVVARYTKHTKKKKVIEDNDIIYLRLYVS